MEKYGYSFLQNSWAPSELDSSVPGGQKGTTGYGFLRNLKTSARMVSWLPDIPGSAAESSSEV